MKPTQFAVERDEIEQVPMLAPRRNGIADPDLWRAILLAHGFPIETLRGLLRNGHLHLPFARLGGALDI